MTTKPADEIASVQELVERFVSIGLAQYDASMSPIQKNITASSARWWMCWMN
jgi:hypothetical protein